MRYKLLLRNEPDEAERLMKLAQEAVELRWATYEHMAKQDPSLFQPMA
jgi:pyruvate-ferredoxin/flavodoxin oxidoreductase